MRTIGPVAVTVQVTAEEIPSVPAWFGEVALVAHLMAHRGLIERLGLQVRLARKRMGTYEVIDFIALLLGYALSGERSLQEYCLRLRPFADAFMALFGRQKMPDRSTLSRFLAAVDALPVEALRTLAGEDTLTHLPPLGGLTDRQGARWNVFDVDGTRQAARQRALPHGVALPMPHRRMTKVAAPGYTGRKRGEVVRTRTTVQHAHTHHWLGTFGHGGNGDARGELLRSLTVITHFMAQTNMPLIQALVRLDGLYGHGAIIADLRTAGVSWVTRGTDYALLTTSVIQERLAQPPDEVTTHPETGTTRLLFDCPAVVLTADGGRCRVIVATHRKGTTPLSVGVEREEVVYELFFTNLSARAFLASDVVALYLHRGSFEITLADEDRELDADRWCSQTPDGQEFWTILAQWAGNLRRELARHRYPTSLVLTEFAPAQEAERAGPFPSSSPPLVDASTQRELPAPVMTWARVARRGLFGGESFLLQPNGTLRCPQGAPLYPEERRQEQTGVVRVYYAGRISHCRPCPLRERCQGHGTRTQQARRVSAVLTGLPPPALLLTSSAPALFPVLWEDLPRCRPRREWIRWIRRQQVTLTRIPIRTSPAPSGPQTRALRGPLAAFLGTTSRAQCPPPDSGLAPRDRDGDPRRHAGGTRSAPGLI